MASLAIDATRQDLNEADSDYGSDFSSEGEQIVQKLLSGRVEIEDNPIINEIEYHDNEQTLRIPRALGRKGTSVLYEAAKYAEQVAEHINQSAEVVYPDLNKPIENSERLSTAQDNPADLSVPDTRSPLARFRTHPKKTLSVTDLVSPAWCELQYWYTLTIHGKKRRTAAMKQGSIVHQTLEKQVHTIVKVDIETKEDAWGLRIWNIIQGLRTLRATGQTRELEVWGIIDGLVVNGVIDELSYVCPDKGLEESLQKFHDDAAPDQATLEEFFTSTKSIDSTTAAQNNRKYRTNKIYLCDVKTRAARSIPAETAFRPTKMQLMLYHYLLGALASNNVDFAVLTARYGLDSSKVFSDSFIAQVGSLNDDDVDTFHDAQSTPNASQGSIGHWSQDSVTTLLAHNTLTTLWSLMISEFQLTIPNGTTSLGQILKAEYRSRDTGAVVGVKTFAMNDVTLQTYLHHELQWWKGERQARGVTVDEAFKCRSCDFAETCEWRLKKVDEAKEKVRLSKKRSSVV